MFDQAKEDLLVPVFRTCQPTRVAASRNDPSLEKRCQEVLHRVEARVLPVVVVVLHRGFIRLGHVRTARLVAERQRQRQRRDAVELRSDRRSRGPRVRPSFEEPRVDQSGGGSISR